VILAFGVIVFLNLLKVLLELIVDFISGSNKLKPEFIILIYRKFYALFSWIISILVWDVYLFLVGSRDWDLLFFTFLQEALVLEVDVWIFELLRLIIRMFRLIKLYF